MITVYLHPGDDESDPAMHIMMRMAMLLVMCCKFFFFFLDTGHMY